MKVDYKDVQEDFQRYQAKIDELEARLAISDHGFLVLKIHVYPYDVPDVGRQVITCDEKNLQDGCAIEEYLGESDEFSKSYGVTHWAYVDVKNFQGLNN